MKSRRTAARPRHIFVYGTLRTASRVPAAKRLAREATYVGTGVVRGCLFDLGEYPGIRLSDDPTDSVTGDVFELSAETADSLLRALDEYEGLGPDEDEPPLYRRTPVQVRMSPQRRITAWTYVMRTKQGSYPRIPIGDYVEWAHSRGARSRSSR